MIGEEYIVELYHTLEATINRWSASIGRYA